MQSAARVQSPAKQRALAAFRRNDRGSLLSAPELAVDQQHLGAFAREEQGGGAAIADGVALGLAGADDDADLALKPHDLAPGK